MARKRRPRPELEREGQIRCRYCGGFYDPALPECPNCGNQTEENQSYSTDWRQISPEECAGGFGGADHMIRRAAGWLAGGLVVLFIIVCVAGVTRGVAWSSGRGVAKPAVIVDTSAPDSSEEPAEETGDDSAAAAQPDQKEPKQDTTEKVDPPDAISLNYTDVTMQAQEELELKATVTPADWKGTVTWSTDNQYVAWVSQQGKVICFGGGNCNITAKAGDQTVTCLVRSVSADADHAAVDTKVKELERQEAKDKLSQVTQKQEQTDTDTDTKKEDKKKKDDKKDQADEEPMTISLTDLTLVNLGDTYQFEITGGDGNYTWTSAGPWVATVDQKGIVTAVGTGYATITCTDGTGKSVSSTVRVLGSQT